MEHSYLTEKQFETLQRYGDGRLKDLPSVFGKLTGSQRDRLHSDDWAYYHELELECRAELAELLHGKRS